MIRTAIVLAESYALQYGGIWHVLDNPYFDVVKESYFFTDSGEPKNKPFKSIYNTKDKMYSLWQVLYNSKNGEITFIEKEDDSHGTPNS